MSALQLIKLCLLLSAGPCAAQTQRKIILILGPPCAGCGTQSPSIVNALGIPHLDTGGMLRDEALTGSPVGLKVKEMMAEGVLVTDDIVNEVVRNRIAQPDCAKGFLLDGYPRNVEQSRVLDAILAETGETVSDVLVFKVPMEGLEQCVTHRWTADGGDEWTSGYFAFREPASFKRLPEGTEAQCARDDLEHCNMWDDWTGEPLFHRDDDNLKTLAQRMKLYNSETGPVIDYYDSKGATRYINGYQPEPKVWDDIASILGADPSKGLSSMPGARPVPAAIVIALVFAAACAIAVAMSVHHSRRDVTAYLLVE